MLLCAANIGLAQFRSWWESLGEGNEASKKYSLGLDSLQPPVDGVIAMLGMQVADYSATVPPEGKAGHALNLTGVFFGNIPVLVRVAFIMDAELGAVCKICVRSNNPQLNTMLTSAIRD